MKTWDEIDREEELIEVLENQEIKINELEKENKELKKINISMIAALDSKSKINAWMRRNFFNVNLFCLAFGAIAGMGVLWLILHL